MEQKKLRKKSRKMADTPYYGAGATPPYSPGDPQSNAAYDGPAGPAGPPVSQLMGAYSETPAGTKTGMTTRKKAALATAAVVGLGALGAAGYVYREELKKFFNWNKLANGAVESSADLLVAKISLALSLCDIEPVDIEAIKRALQSAKKEAQSVANINKQLQAKLDKIVSAQPAEPPS